MSDESSEWELLCEAMDAIHFLAKQRGVTPLDVIIMDVVSGWTIGELNEVPA